MEQPQRLTIDISMSAILRVIGVLLGLWFLYQIRDIALLLFLVLIVVMALDPIVGRLQKKMPRALAVGLVFVIIIGFLALALGLIFPPLISQISDLAVNLPTYTDKLHSITQNFQAPLLENATLVQRVLASISEQLSNVSRGFIGATLGLLGGLVTFLTVVVMSVYLLLEEKGFRNFVISLLPVDNREDVYGAVNKIGDKLGAWLRGQLILMLIIGIAAIVWSTLLGLPYALTLGLWAGLTEVVPFLGPIIGGLPIVFIALLGSPLKALIALVLLTVTQQLESNFLVPKIMQRSVGLSPIIVILALLIGSKLFGITGTILSVPLAATLMVVIQEWPKLFRRRQRS